MDFDFVDFAIQIFLYIILIVGFFVAVILLGVINAWTRRLEPDSKENDEKDLNSEEPGQKSSIVLKPPVPVWQKYPEIYRFEILYWRGVSKSWWWNNYAKDLVEYASEYFPWNRVDFYSSFNSNSKSQDPNDIFYRDRIRALKSHKISKHPLVVINYDQEYIMVNSRPALEAMKDRIDAEWLRHYKIKKTYR